MDYFSTYIKSTKTLDIFNEKQAVGLWTKNVQLLYVLSNSCVGKPLCLCCPGQNKTYLIDRYNVNTVYKRFFFTRLLFS